MAPARREATYTVRRQRPLPSTTLQNLSYLIEKSVPECQHRLAEFENSPLGPTNPQFLPVEDQIKRISVSRARTCPIGRSVRRRGGPETGLLGDDGQAYATVTTIQTDRNGAARKRDRGTSKSRVSIASNSKSLPHSGTGHLALYFFLFTPPSVCCPTTTQAPHFGHVTHEHAMRSAIPRLYCAWNRAPWMAQGSGKIPTFLGLGDFVAVRTLGGGLGGALDRSSQRG